MDWSNESVLEFIELLEREACIWNPKSNHHNNRNSVNGAWARIQSKISVRHSIEDLKKKRNTLLTQYRHCLRKIKESTNTDSGADEIYRPSWFAFSAIHNYMGPIYNCRSSLSAVPEDSRNESQIKQEEHSADAYFERPPSRESNIDRSRSRDSNTDRPSVSRETNSETGSDPSPFPKRQREEMDQTFPLIKNRCNNRENVKESRECDLYGQLLAHRLKSLDEDDRLVLMNEIDNVVFRYVINARKRTGSARSD